MVLKWSYNSAMSLNLSIKNVPDDVAERLRERARRNHRSLQGELRAILDAASMELRASESLVREAPAAYSAENPAANTRTPRAAITARDAYERATAAFGTYKPAVPIADEIRQMRDERTEQLMKVMKRARGRR